jgi:3-oxoacyl-[acyl-carrier protein] reductase
LSLSTREENAVGKLDGKVAIVTGAARGLGRAYAHRLASLGASVAVCDLDLKSYAEFELDAQAMTAETTVAEIKTAGGRAAGYQLDVTDEAAVKKMVDDVAATWGRIDILVCNAGGLDEDSAPTTSALSKASIQFTVDLNLVGTANVVHAAADYLKAQRSGRIVTISSVAASMPNKEGGGGDYGAAKAAVATYTRYLAQELGPFGITANCIVPGSIGTGKMSAPGAATDELIPRIALRRTGTVEDCAKVVEFLCTDLSDYVTGALIPVDGGIRSTDVD